MPEYLIPSYRPTQFSRDELPELLAEIAELYAKGVVYRTSALAWMYQVLQSKVWVAHFPSVGAVLDASRIPHSSYYQFAGLVHTGLGLGFSLEETVEIITVSPGALIEGAGAFFSGEDVMVENLARLGPVFAPQEYALLEAGEISCKDAARATARAAVTDSVQKILEGHPARQIVGDLRGLGGKLDLVVVQRHDGSFSYNAAWTEHDSKSPYHQSESGTILIVPDKPDKLPSERVLQLISKLLRARAVRSASGGEDG